jgi:hypothetical protein
MVGSALPWPEGGGLRGRRRRLRSNPEVGVAAELMDYENPVETPSGELQVGPCCGVHRLQAVVPVSPTGDRKAPGKGIPTDTVAIPGLIGGTLEGLESTPDTCSLPSLLNQPKEAGLSALGHGKGAPAFHAPSSELST